MTENKLEILITLIGELISSPGTWQEKRDSLLDVCSSDDRINLEEFAGWFDE